MEDDMLEAERWDEEKWLILFTAFI